jgi:eukaryotic-like serine/threonine-protein kinase
MKELTSPPKPPWWAYLIAAPFVLDIGFLVYLSFMAHGPAGVSFDFRQGKQVVRQVSSGLPMEKAGARPGDVLVAVNGQPLIDSEDWNIVRGQFEPERPISLVVKRADRQLQLTMVIPRTRIWRNYTRSDLLLEIVTAGIGVICLALGLLLLFSRPRHFVAVLGALVLFSMGDLIAGGPQYETAALFRHLPWIVQVLIFSSNFGVAPYVSFLFFGLFPRPIFRRRWILPLLVLPGIAASGILSIKGYHVLYTPEHVTGVLPHGLLAIARAVVLAYILAALIMFAVGYRGLQDANERRRARLILSASAVSCTAIAGFIFLLYFARGSAVAHWVLTSPGIGFVVLFLWAVFPIAFAYALLRHRLFDVRLIIRQGLQYAFARGVLLSLVPASLGVLILDMALHRNQTVGAILSERGWLYLVVGGFGYLLQRNRQRWLDTLDRRFFRERYNAQQLLHEIVDEIRGASSFEAEMTRVVARIEAALHPELVALLTRSPRETFYRSIACAPAGMAPSAVSADSKLMSLIRVLGKPVQISLSESGWLRQQLPQSETEFLRESRLDLIIPIALSPERTEAVMVLGAKRSEEPYSREDEELLLAIASALAILIERPAPQRAMKQFEECPKCGTVYDSGAMRCPADGEALKPAVLARTLAGRYRLDRRLGMGGMGTVYRALDTALERDVAVKLIREELVASADAAERFRGEAKAAAAFSHPNLVTVYDFGIEAGSRAFLVMELLLGATLRQELQSKTRFTPGHVVTILRGICAAIEAAHERGLVHRDLKPENIFLVRGGPSQLPKVLDFGLAKFVTAAAGATLATMETSAGVLLGTPRYMSPEQLRGEAVGKSSDLWALAVISYEMLTGAHPFHGTTAAECHELILAGRLVPYRQHISESASALDIFFAEALSPDWNKRPSSATALLARLEAALNVGLAQAS